MVRELQPGVVLVEVMADGGGEVVDEGTEGQVVLQSLNGVATCTGGSRGGLGVGDGEDGRRDGGDDGFKERMEGDFLRRCHLHSCVDPSSGHRAISIAPVVSRVTEAQIASCTQGHENIVEDVSWNLKDENMFGSSGDDCKLIIWDLRTNKAQQSVKPHEKEGEKIKEKVKKVDENEVVKLIKEQEDKNLEISALKVELETTKRTYEVQFSQMEEEANNFKATLTRKVQEYEHQLEELRNELEEDAKDAKAKLTQKAQEYENQLEALGNKDKSINVLEWSARQKIAVGASRGLRHQNSQKIAMHGVFGLIWECSGNSALAIGIGGVLGSEGRVFAIDLSPRVVVVVVAYNDKMTQEMSQSDNFTKISANDIVGKVMGKDHTGHVHCLGLGGLRSVAFRSTTSYSGGGSSFSNSDSAENSRLKEEVTCLRDKLTTSKENVKTLKNDACIHPNEGRAYSF
ncbi:hypothetical protein JHK85_023264 [Glycine max]|nr:hypothetical protein JHK85_023264 [Glycine max]KAG5026882.1 hypothetical protein JHK86_022796 [Glycine max]